MSNILTVVVGHKIPKPENWDSMSIDERHGSWPFTSFRRRGKLRSETIMREAKRIGMVGNIKVSYHSMDYSGKGRSYIVSSLEMVLP